MVRKYIELLFKFNIPRQLLLACVVTAATIIVNIVFPTFYERYKLLAVEFLFGVFLLAFLIYILLYHKDINENLKAMLLDQGIKDITISRKSKLITINKEGLDKKECNVVLELDIENHMPERYEKYLFGVESDCYVPDISEIIADDGKHHIKLNKENTEYDMWLCKSFNLDENKENEIKKSECEFFSPPDTCKLSPQLSNIRMVECEFFIPLNLDSDETKTLTVKYPTKAFPGVFSGKLEHTSMIVLQHMDKLIFQIKLDPYLKRDYYLTDEENENAKGEHVLFEVVDSSRQRMLNYEKILKSKNMVPHFKKTEIQWTISNPMIGYTYHLYFTMKPVAKKPSLYKKRSLK